MRDLLPVALVVCVLLAAALGAAVGVVYWLSFALGPPTAPPGKFLVYEIDPTFTTNPASVDMPKLIAAINQRINPGWSRNARVRPLENRLIEIAVFGEDLEKVHRIERLLEQSGTLEFRVLANQHDHGALIEQAKRETGNVVRDPAGKPLAWWVPIKEGFNVQGWGFATRIKKVDDLETSQVLVLADEFNVTGAYLKRAVVERDPQGQPSLAFELNVTGANLLAGLTSSHLPDPSSGIYCMVGIIFNGRLFSPLGMTMQMANVGRHVIQIPTRGRPDNPETFTEEEAEELVRVLDSGPLPAAIRKAESSMEEAKPEKPAEEPTAEAENAP